MRLALGGGGAMRGLMDGRSERHCWRYPVVADLGRYQTTENNNGASPWGAAPCFGRSDTT